jgi:hypothetical protein
MERGRREHLSQLFKKLEDVLISQGKMKPSSKVLHSFVEIFFFVNVRGKIPQITSATTLESGVGVTGQGQHGAKCKA